MKKTIWNNTIQHKVNATGGICKFSGTFRGLMERAKLKWKKHFKVGFYDKIPFEFGFLQFWSALTFFSNFTKAMKVNRAQHRVQRIWLTPFS